MDLEKVVEFLQVQGTSFVINLVAAIVIFVIGRWIAKLLHRLVIKP